MSSNFFNTIRIFDVISITSDLAKIFEKTLIKQITEYLNRNNLIGPSQFDFRKKMSTSDALILATENVKREIDENKIVAAACRDLSIKSVRFNFPSNFAAKVRATQVCHSQRSEVFYTEAKRCFATHDEDIDYFNMRIYIILIACVYIQKFNFIQ